MAKEKADDDGTCDNQGIGQAGGMGEAEVTPDVAKGEEDQRGEENGGEENDGLFFFPPNRTEGIGQSAENDAE